MNDDVSSSMIFFKTHLASTVLASMALAVHYGWWQRAHSRKWMRLLVLGLVGLVLAAFFLESQRIRNHLPVPFCTVLHSVGLGWSLATLALFGSQLVDRFLMGLFSRKAPLADVVPSPERRRLLQVARSAVYATPAVALGYGTFIERDDFRVEEITIPIANLPRDLEGLKMVQITDIHMGPFMSQRSVERIVSMANETRANLAIMTGDLVTGVGDPVEVCLKLMSRVKADAGMIGCMGNHEIYAHAQDYVYEEGRRLGIRFLRKQNLTMEFRGHKLNFGGVDYQKKDSPYLVGTESLMEPGMPNILLSHSPDVFPVAAKQGWDLTLAGHTHGGQITVEYLQQFVNPARFVTRFVSGLYAEGDKRIYVSRGLGTVGVPTRLGARPELSVIRLACGPKAAV